MSIMTLVTRIIPISAPPSSYSNLPLVSELCGQSKVHTNTFTDAETGDSYAIESTFVEVKVLEGSVENMQKRLADHFETVRGMKCVRKNGLDSLDNTPVERISPAVEGTKKTSGRDAEVFRLSVEKNAFFLSIANSIPRKNPLCDKSNVEITHSAPSKNNESIIPSAQTTIANSVTNLSQNNFKVSKEIQIVKDSHGCNQGGSDSLKSKEKTSALTNNCNIKNRIITEPKINKENLDKGNSSNKNEHDNSFAPDSEMFHLMKKFVNNKCLICGFVSSRKYKRSGSNHMFVHAKQRPFKCHKCGKAFASQTRWTQHQVIHLDKFPFACGQCGKRFRRSGERNQHVQRHEKNIKHRCELCDKGFTFLNSLKSHALIHTGEKPFSCNICNKQYSSRKTLNWHLIWHTGEKPFKCGDCGKAYQNKKYLNIHKIMHREKKFKCDTCKSKFNFASNLAQHKLIHSENREHSCTKCDKKFKLPHHLRQHLATHT